MLDNEDIDILVHEVGPRDGLQATKVIMPTEAKIAWIRALKNAGLKQIQVGSFVSPNLLPQMADTREVVAAAREIGGFCISALVPNLRGAIDAIAAGVDQINFVMSVSEAHNLKNVKKTREQSIEEFRCILEHRNNSPEAKNVLVSGGLATCFGCTIAGVIAKSEVLRLVDEMLKIGADRIGIADTVGYGNPRQVFVMFTEVLRLAGRTPVGAHFHDTRGLGLANAYAAIEAGVRTLDGCQGGLGGCPYAPGATGNVVTEDLVFMIESMGLRTGIDLDKLLLARAVMASYLGDEPIYGSFVKAGAPKGFRSRTNKGLL